MAKKSGIIDADFYLADLLSKDNVSIVEKLFAVLKKDYYEFNEKKTELGSIIAEKTGFKDHQKAHKEFWAIYERPPREEFWDYIIKRRDLLVDQDIRERKGAFFTPRIWVDKACEYLSKTFGEDYEDEYYIWDLAGGTGNLLANFTNKKNIFCSTLDKADIDVIHERIKNGANLFEKQVFQFDFLNDEFFDECDNKGNIIKKSKLPLNLQEILKDENKRKKLIIFINPPYAEVGLSSGGINKTGVQYSSIYDKYKDILGKSSRELFAQFFIRIYCEIEGAILASFSKLKYVNSTNFIKFRESFKAKFLKGFITPAYTFDNVKGNFPIGFLIWDTSKKEEIKKIKLDVFNENGNFLGKKNFFSYKNSLFINQWLDSFCKNINSKKVIIFFNAKANDFQHNNRICFGSSKKSFGNGDINLKIYISNLINIAIYFSVRHAIAATWINDRDQFLYPNKLYDKDDEFKSDCLAFMLFHGQNRISSKEGTNHFIPFSEKELNITKEAFESDFMYKFINGKIKDENSLFGDELAKIEFSPQAKELLKAGKELFKYYHTHSEDKNYLVNASFYDIKEFFQGRDEKGKMNTPAKAKDEHYKFLLSQLNESLNTLAKKIEPKIYEYGFLKE